MSESSTYLAIFLGSRDSPRMAAWLALPEAERKSNEREGIAAWKAWMEKHQADIAAIGGPLGKTKRVSGQGVEDVSNAMGGFTVVSAESHEAAAKLFENHPHFAIFPGEAIEVMPVLPIPGADPASIPQLAIEGRGNAQHRASAPRARTKRSTRAISAGSSRWTISQGSWSPKSTN